jgi:putative cell wall binding repeat protein
MPRSTASRRAVAVYASAVLVLLSVGGGISVGLGSGQAALAASTTPSYFPSGAALDGSAYTLQFAGSNREATAATIALDEALSASPTAGYPFSSTTIRDKTSFADLYGPGACPTAAVLVADDTPADALAASALRGYAALPVTDAAGQAKTFDTTHTALFLTESGREGATGLDATTAAAINRILSKCNTIPAGIVLGGTTAIPDSVFTAFAALVGDAARIAGTDRYQTAAQVAEAAEAGGKGLPAVSYYASATAPSPVGTGGSSLAKAVFLAEGLTGADALAVGALAARSGVPVLLTQSTTLPQGTVDALTRLAPKNIIVLGGTSAVSADVLTAAATAAGSGTQTTRIAGVNRYATSVAIAEQLFNLYPAYASIPGSFSDQLFGVARDEGSYAAGNHVGWPDALASAYYLAELATSKVSDPARLAPPVEKTAVSGVVTETQIAPTAACGGTGSACFANYPLLLTTGAGLAPEVDAYLKAMYPSTGSYKSGAASPPGASDGGFAFIFGGSGAVSAADQASLGLDLSGGTYTAAASTDLAPSLAAAPGPFYTTADLSAFGPATPAPGTTPLVLTGGTTDPKVCVAPAAATGVAGILAIDQTGATAGAEPVEYYGGTAAYPAASSLGSCVDVKTETAISGSSDTVGLYGASLSGHETALTTVAFPASTTLFSGAAPGTPTGSLGPPATMTGGDVFAPVAGATSTTETLTYTPASSSTPQFPFTYRGTTYNTGALRLTITLVRSAGANGADVLAWTATVNGYVNAGSATPVFTASVGKGYVDATPAAGTAILTPINLLGVYGAAGNAGAVVLEVSPPTTPTGSPSVSGLEISGLS